MQSKGEVKKEQKNESLKGAAYYAAYGERLEDSNKYSYDDITITKASDLNGTTTYFYIKDKYLNSTVGNGLKFAVDIVKEGNERLKREEAGRGEEIITLNDGSTFKRKNLNLQKGAAYWRFYKKSFAASGLSYDDIGCRKEGGKLVFFVNNKGYDLD